MIKTFCSKLLPIIIIFVTFFSQTAQQKAFGEENLSGYNLVYEKINPSIVSIEANLDIGISSGTGCIVDENGTILTSLHVVNKSKNIEVTTSALLNKKYIPQINSIYVGDSVDVLHFYKSN